MLRDVGTMLRHIGTGGRRVLGLSTAGFFRPDLSLPAYVGLVPTDGLSPIYNYFDRTGGGNDYGPVVTRVTCRDYRGGRLTYDEHDGTDFVCPPGTPLASAAPGVVVAVRDRFLRGGLTASVDHGAGVVTQYTHLSRMMAEVGQPLERGETVALSGTSGLDMLSGFPWVAPHVHFMVWVRGRPVDPYLAPGERTRVGSWMHENDPKPSGPLADDPSPLRLEDVRVRGEAVEEIVALCMDPSIKRELEGARSLAERLAILEDSLHHERRAWPGRVDPEGLRPPQDAKVVRLTLPLPRSDYRGSRAVDAPWTRP